MATEDLETIVVTGQPLPSNWSLTAPLSPLSRIGNIDALTNTGGGAGGGASSYNAGNSASNYVPADPTTLPIGKVNTAAGKVYGLKNLPISSNTSLGLGYNPSGNKVGATITQTFKKGGDVKAAPKKAGKAAPVKVAKAAPKKAAKAAPKKGAKPNPMFMAKAAQMNMMQPPIMKKAAGGAAKVRKGMASPEGKIIEAMNRIRGK